MPSTDTVRATGNDAFRHIKISHEDLLNEARLRFGQDPLDIAFQCPHCDDIASLRDFQKHDVDPGRAGQECIGRHLGALDKQLAPGTYTGRGCNWVSYGLIRGPWEITLPAEEGKPERSMWAFPLAGDPHPDGPIARALATAQEPTR